MAFCVPPPLKPGRPAATTHWRPSEHSLVRESFNALVAHEKVDATDIMIRESSMGRQAELGPDWCPTALLSRRVAENDGKRPYRREDTFWRETKTVPRIAAWASHPSEPGQTSGRRGPGAAALRYAVDGMPQSARGDRASPLPTPPEPPHSARTRRAGAAPAPPTQHRLGGQVSGTPRVRSATPQEPHAQWLGDDPRPISAPTRPARNIARRGLVSERWAANRRPIR
mmetsp:Transcript_36507/g.105166  ORF Transcript_36507/g.105166 Transcript_36507/m.105166 type:complete len:227 (-) Transcript_36507:171-851(-)